MMSHTSIPWRVAVYDTEGAVVRAVNTGQRVAEFAYYEDGEAAVRAVNSHAGLVAALKHMLTHCVENCLCKGCRDAHAAIEEAEGQP